MKHKRFFSLFCTAFMMFVSFGFFKSDILYLINSNAAQNKTLNINWSEIKKVGTQNPSGCACACYATAYCRTILDGYAHFWTEYDANDGASEYSAYCIWGKGNYYMSVSSSKLTLFQQAFNSLNDGRPFIIHVYNYTKSYSNEHWVSVVGYTGVSDFNNLNESNFLIIDPASSTSLNSPLNLGTTSWRLLYDDGYQYRYTDTGCALAHNDTDVPQNITIKSDNITAMVGGTMSFWYTINNADKKGIGIDKDGSRYASIPVHDDSGRVNYTFSEPGTYCVITEGSNSKGYACCDGVWINVVEPTIPQNITITSDNKTAMVGGTMEFNYSIDYAYNQAVIAIEKNGKRFETIHIHGSPGTEYYTFKETGDYYVFVEGKNSEGYACCDGIWINVVEPTVPQNIKISSDNTTVMVGAAMRFEYSIDYAYDAAGIGIDKDRKRYVSIPVHRSPGTIEYVFNETGTYCVITEGRNSEGYACCDGIWITVVDSSVPPQNVTISSEKKNVVTGDTLTFDYSIDYAYNTAHVVIEKNKQKIKTLSLNHSPGTVDYLFTEAGEYTIYTEGSNDYGYSRSKEITVIVVLEGDCNNDGEFNISDVVLFQKWLLAVPDSSLKNWQSADFCKDDRLDVFDLCLMRKELISR